MIASRHISRVRGVPPCADVILMPVKTLARARTNSLAVEIGFSVVVTVLALLVSVYWVPTGWRWSLVLPASVVLGAGPLSWWLRKRRDASRS